jgi:hypothetical protein
VIGQTCSKKFKAEVISRCVGIPPFNELNEQQLMDLYHICDNECEGFDGEPVSLDRMITVMTIRFNDVGLAPSRD